MAKSKSSIPEDQMKDLEARFGKGTIIKASDKKFVTVKEKVSTGSLTLDLAIDGGIPKGGLATCILGKESSSKTTTLLHIIAEDQKKGNLCAFCDPEGTLDLDYSESLGVNLDMLHIVDRESLLKSLGIKDREIISGEEWIEIAAKMLKSNLYGVVGFDSVACLIPMAEITSGLAGVQIGRIAAMMSKAYRAINAALSVSNSAFVYLNQYRMNPGGYGNPFIEPGGEAWKYLQALKIEISKSLDKDTDGVYGIVVKGKVTKSKVCQPFREFEYYVKFGSGIQRDWEVFQLALQHDIVIKTGGWYTVEGMDTKIQGEDNMLQFLQDNPEFSKVVEDKVMKKIGKHEEIATEEIKLNPKEDEQVSEEVAAEAES